MIQKSMSLRYEPASEPLHISDGGPLEPLSPLFYPKPEN